MTPTDIATITKAMGSVIREFTSKAVADAVAPLLARNAALELRILELETHPSQTIVSIPGPMGEKGETGPGVTSLVVTAEERLLAHLTDGRSLDAGPVPRGLDGAKGEPGERGADGQVGQAGPAGARGEVGPQGPSGAAGERGEKGLDGQPGAPGERGLPGEKGLDGLAGRDGRDGAPGPAGAIGEKGLDGRNGKDGINGKDGLDGLGFDDYDLTLDETRGWLFRLSQGSRVKEWELGLPFDAKVWAPGPTYPKGAGVTHDGGWWIAQAPTTEAPGEGCPAWRLAVRRGKQGREGQKGKDGAPGRDLTQIDPATGRKW